MKFLSVKHNNQNVTKDERPFILTQMERTERERLLEYNILQKGRTQRGEEWKDRSMSIEADQLGIA